MAKWHLSKDLGDARGLVLYCNHTTRINAQHMTVSRERFERMAKSARCVDCAKELAAYKARLIAEVAEIERNQPPVLT